ncbi:uncharacterized protein MYU51_002957 [Penicillium brevicompactum]|uniref:uncharacterized protein n=1 Tax=Penicillium brevicompactum TaxID=5074 RepID=UPI002542506E|nr:uncharacterized protein N7506_011263 [Penicillium brevicompactum]KAJ5322133.1 hypothetical protein N7506_011263 [Penicillium brevicompactum]
MDKSKYASGLSGAAASFNPDHGSAEVQVGNGDEPAAPTPKTGRSQGIADPDDFMTQFRKLRLIKQKAAKAAAAGPVRRVIFGDLPDWATVSRMLLLTHGGAVEYAWNEEGTVAVQFIEEAACLDYYEKHSDGIKYVTADGEEAIITVTMPEEGLRDHAELAQRVAEGASRVVCLEGLAPGFKDGDGTPILGVLAQDEWHDLKFERILITQAESGVDVAISFYDLHDAWKFYQDIKDGTYDCISRFEVDPCARATAYHFIDEPNPAFESIRE